MTERSRAFLKSEFDDGERPSGADFSDLIESFINKTDDGVSIDNDGNVSIPGGINLGDTPNGQPGTLRFSGGQVEVFDGGSFTSIGGGGGAFTPVAATLHVAYGSGNVGIGNFAVPPTHKLEVDLNANTSTDERVRFGQLVIHNGPSNNGAHVSHQNVAGSNTSFALRQDSQGNTTVNSRFGTPLLFTQGGQTRVQVTGTGNLSLMPQSSLSVTGHTAIGSLVQNRNLSVYGQARKLNGGPFQNLLSDERAKKDLRPLDKGLEAVCKLEPVYFKYNSTSGLDTDETEYVGLTAQNVQEHLPFMVQESEIKAKDTDEPLLTYDQAPLEFIMINAIKELTKRIETLEAVIEELKNK